MMNLIRFKAFLFVFLFSVIAFAQNKVKDYIMEGNEFYEDGKFDQAEYAYKRAALEDPTSVKANYNLGNALFKQKRYKESVTHYNRSAEIAKSNSDKHQAYHNAGNAYLEEQEYEKAVNSFKQALKNNPYDDTTRHNFAYAKKMLEKQQQKQNQQNKKDDSSQDNESNKDKQEQNNKDQQQGNQPENQQNNKQNNKDQEDQQQNNQREKTEGNPKSGGENGNQKGKGNQPNSQITQGSKGDGSEQDQAQNGLGEGMLRALEEQEVRTQRRIIQQKADKQRTNTSKDW